MAVYKGNQSILNAALGDFAVYGFSLAELDDHTTVLYYNGIKTAVFNQDQLTIPVLHESCRAHLVNLGFVGS